MEERRGRGSAFWLVGGVLLFAVATLGICVVPLADCPDYTHSVYSIFLERPPESCPRCAGRWKVTLLRRWLHP